MWQQYDNSVVIDCIWYFPAYYQCIALLFKGWWTDGNRLARDRPGITLTIKAMKNLLPLCCHLPSSVLPDYCHISAMLLPYWWQCNATLVSWHCHFRPSLLPVYSQNLYFSITRMGEGRRGEWPLPLTP